MSRIGKMPITVPAGVKVEIDEKNFVTVTGPKGTLSGQLNTEMVIKRDGDTITVERPSDDRIHRSLHGLTRTLLANMVNGTDKGFSKELEVNGPTSRRSASSLLRSEGSDPPSLIRARALNTLPRSFAAKKARPAVRNNRRCA